MEDIVLDLTPSQALRGKDVRRIPDDETSVKNILSSLSVYDTLAPTKGDVFSCAYMLACVIEMCGFRNCKVCIDSELLKSYYVMPVCQVLIERGYTPVFRWKNRYISPFEEK